MRYSNVTSLYVATPLAFNAPDGRFPWDDLSQIRHQFIYTVLMSVRSFNFYCILVYLYCLYIFVML